MWIQEASLFMWKQLIFTKTLQKMWKKIWHFKLWNRHTGENKKLIGLMNDELAGQIMK